MHLPSSHWIQKAKTAVFPLKLYANVLNLYIHKTFRSGYASCIMQWASATPSPNPVIIIPNSFIFSHSPFHIFTFSLLSSPHCHDKQNIISVTPKAVQILGISSVAFSKHGICRRWALEICFQKISQVILKISQVAKFKSRYYLESFCMLRETEADICT